MVIKSQGGPDMVSWKDIWDVSGMSLKTFLCTRESTRVKVHTPGMSPEAGYPLSTSNTMGKLIASTHSGDRGDVYL